MHRRTAFAAPTNLPQPGKLRRRVTNCTWARSSITPARANSTTKRGSFKYKNSWKLLVVRQNADGGWRLLVRNGMAYARTSKDADGDAAEPMFNPERVTVAWCDLAADGRVAENPTLGVHARCRAKSCRGCQPTLGKTNGRRRTRPRRRATRMQCCRPPMATQSIFGSVPKSKALSTSSISALRKRRFSFDTERGLVDRVDSENTQGYGFSGKGQGQTTLTNIENRDPNWCTAVAVEMNDYFAVKQEYDELLELRRQRAVAHG